MLLAEGLDGDEVNMEKWELCYSSELVWMSVNKTV